MILKMTDLIKLDRPFVVTCNRCGAACELEKYVVDSTDATCPACGHLERKEFTVTCPNCGSTSPKLDNDIRRGSSWTGLYGIYEITCECGNSEVVFDP
jgi:ssDNA-binding Zn-finger/Zn-ribbon topoisomerase 1